MSVEFTGPINLAQLQNALGDLPSCVLCCEGGDWASAGSKLVSCPSLTVTDGQIAAALASTTYSKPYGWAAERAALVPFLELAAAVGSGQTPAANVTLVQLVEALVALADFLPSALGLS